MITEKEQSRAGGKGVEVKKRHGSMTGGKREGEELTLCPCFFFTQHFIWKCRVRLLGAGVGDVFQLGFICSCQRTHRVHGVWVVERACACCLKCLCDDTCTHRGMIVNVLRASVCV